MSIEFDEKMQKFAFSLGIVIGGLYSDDVTKTLAEAGVPSETINSASFHLCEIARIAFYGKTSSIPD